MKLKIKATADEVLDELSEYMDSYYLQGEGVEGLSAAIEKIITQQLGDHLAAITGYRHATNSLAIEAGVLQAHVDHSEIDKSALGDVYCIELLAEVEQRFSRLSVRYEKLRAASGVVISGPVSINAAIEQLEEALK